MLSETKLSLLKELVSNATKDELIWTKGYLSGFLENSAASQKPLQLSIENGIKPLIIYGTETGNSKKVASGLLANLKKKKIQAKALDVFQFDFSKLEKETHILFIMSTQGEGEFPQNAIGFYEKLLDYKSDLTHLTYSVFGLGDSSYPLFCNAGILLDEALFNKGARRLLPIVKADVDFVETALAWEKDLHSVFENQTQVIPQTPVAPKSSLKKNYTGKITHRVILNDRGSNKETYHIEITGDDSVQYLPGDALGIIPKNNESHIKTIVDYFILNTSTKITIGNETADIYNFLQKRNITGLSKRSLSQIGQFFGTDITQERADFVDLLENYPIDKEVNPEDLIGLLLPIAPRLYSISSSFEAHDGQVHLTVNLNRFEMEGKTKCGLASHYLSNLPAETDFDFYIHKNENFRLPDDTKDIIMIGPGTGIAPFRSFISHRDSAGSDGRNWLFFGEQHFVQDFYYQTEIQDWLNSGVLSKLDVAFSRDQQQKIYVQDRIRENAKEFNQWLENGAFLYLCGQKFPMSVDVEDTIVEVIASQRNISQTQAQEILENMASDKRYQKDVY